MGLALKALVRQSSFVTAVAVIHRTTSSNASLGRNRPASLRRLLGALSLGVGLTGSPPLAASERTLVAWDFSAPGDLKGWQANAHVSGLVVTNGAMRFRTVGSDPLLELTTPLVVAASPRQFIEVRLRAGRDGMAEWFWSNTREGRYGGFSQDKTTRFQVRGDGNWRAWRVFPFWHAEERITRLRFDLFDGAEFDLASIRIREVLADAPAVPADFTFTNTTAGWVSAGGAEFAATADGLEMRVADADGFALAPPVAVDAAKASFVTVELTADRGRQGTLLFATDATSGLHRFSFPIETSGQPFTYNLDLLAAREWRGRIIALGLQPTDEPGARARVRSLRVGAAPVGPPHLQVKAFAAEDAVLRAGRPARLSAVVVNGGATGVTNLTVSLTGPAGFRVKTGPPENALPTRIGFDEEVSLTWTVVATAAGDVPVQLAVSADNAEPVDRAATLRVTPDLNLAPADYVPEPTPVRGDVEVGAYYFPGWRSAGQWQPIRHFPERRPALGWYREGDPEVADWHIKWAVEHGITFFAYDWYWSQGARQLEHGLRDGYFRARYRHLLKFCLLWANHNPPGTHSHEDCLAVTRHWIANYFHRPEHLRIEGRPVVILFNPGGLTTDLGVEGTKRAIAAMREECVRAGLPGLYLLACVADAGEARRAAAEGYDAITTYNWAGLGMTGGGLFAPYETLIAGYQRQWAHLRETSPLPMMTPLSGGWDSRPWHGQNNLVRHGRTPELFRRHLTEAREFLAAHPPRSPVERFVLVEAWNEWGEGSYIEPHQEFGFGYLDALREVFTTAAAEHLDVVPADVGRGPYEAPMDSPGRTDWTFDQTDEGWGDGMYLTDQRVGDGALTARTGGSDAAFFGPPLQASAAGFRLVELRLKLTPTDGQSFTDFLQLFWRTSRVSESEATSVRAPVTADGTWRVVRLPVAENLRWRGIITRLRLDPCTRAGVEVSLDRLRLVP